MKTIYQKDLFALNAETLLKMGVKCIFLDVDNTIRKYNSDSPDVEAVDFVNKMFKSGIDIVLCSNNTKGEVKPFADKLRCKYVAFSLKPSPFGMIRALKKTSARHSEILLIGDQVFNDIFAGKLFGIKTMLVEPIDREHEPSTVTARRRLFKYFEEKIIDNKNPFQE